MDPCSDPSAPYLCYIPPTDGPTNAGKACLPAAAPVPVIKFGGIDDTSVQRLRGTVYPAITAVLSNMTSTALGELEGRLCHAPQLPNTPCAGRKVYRAFAPHEGH